MHSGDAHRGAVTILTPRRDSIGLTARLAALPHAGLPLRRPVQIHWDAHQIPFILAQSDHDFAVALGVVHVHLRWTQMELMRHVAQGRVAELAGPFGVETDRILRTLHLGKAVPAMAAALPAETRSWTEAFLAGANHAIRHAPTLPPEFRLLGLRRTPWTLEDVLCIGRLAAFDVTWMVWLALLADRNDPGIDAFWRGLLGSEAALLPAGEDPTPAGPLARARSVLLRFARAGSNAWAIGPDRSETGHAWLAGDTHLSALLPNLWLIAGGRSPGFHAAGLMVPGIPAVMVGRNAHIAWGGTNLHAASSDLFDVSGLPPDAIVTRQEEIRVRFAGRRRLAVRETEFGPVISDLARLAPAGGTVALRWMGHRPSDELSALLGVNRARDWAGFRAALEGLGVPGQNMLYADAEGHVGKAMAVHLPHRPAAPATTPLLPPSAGRAWRQVVRGGALPAAFDPAEGFVASANDRPPKAEVLVGYFFSSAQRIDRLRAILGGGRRLGFRDIAALQQDVGLPAAAPVRDRVVVALRALPQPAARRLADLLAGWDGTYAANAEAPLAFELLLYHLAMALYGPRRLRAYAASWSARTLLFRALQELPRPRLAALLRGVLPRVDRGVRRFRVWGAMHRLEPQHPLATLPGIGRLFRFGDWPASGGSDTVMKTAGPLTDRRHRAALASTARFIADLSDLDASWFALLGGQDGWIGSTTLTDQVPLWRRGAYIQVPLRPETVRETYPHMTELHP
ncbi:MAG: penicillin acylase family protein [Rhodospirillales bacterium]|nr:penicillin acylase family protein [Rhodospirillales bacterium]